MCCMWVVLCIALDIKVSSNGSEWVKIVPQSPKDALNSEWKMAVVQEVNKAYIFTVSQDLIIQQTHIGSIFMGNHGMQFFGVACCL